MAFHLLFLSNRSSTAHTTTVCPLLGWWGDGVGTVSQLVVLLCQTLAGTRSSTAHTTTVCPFLDAPKIRNPRSCYHKQKKPSKRNRHAKPCIFYVVRGNTHPLPSPCTIAGVSHACWKRLLRLINPYDALQDFLNVILLPLLPSLRLSSVS